MPWRKLGRIFVPDGKAAWARTHAMVPTPLVLGDDAIRVYVTMCDENMVGRIGFVEVDARDPRRILRVSKEPVLDIGRPGCFDDNGVNPLSLLVVGEEIWLYYLGYQLGTRVRYFVFTGLAISRDKGETFERYRSVPILDRTDGETVVRSSVCVRPTATGYRMWYVSGDEFVMAGDRMRPTYVMRHLTSPDGKAWPTTQGPVVMPLSGPDEFGVARPFVIEDKSGFRMWFSSRKRSVGYRLAYAESSDGLTWRRLDDQVGIDVSPEGWDSEATCYASVVPTRFGTYLFYNGNDYGRTGLGVAVAD